MKIVAKIHSYVIVHLGLEVPEEIVAQLVRVAQTTLDQEAGHRRVVVRLILEHLRLKRQI